MAVFPVVCSSENTGMDYHAQGLSRLLHYTLCLVALPINSVCIQTHMISLATKLVSQANLSNNRYFRIASCLPDLVEKKMSLNGTKIRGVLLDITGVLMESSSVAETGLDIPGSVDAVQKLVDAGVFRTVVLILHST